MKQDAFIQRLRQGLASLPKQEVDEIIADYREYIGDAMAAGRNEEEVLAALGDPDKLARELKAQATYRQWEARRSFGNLARVVVSIAGLGLLNLILFIPFMLYLTLLTAGYMVSGAFALGGLIAVVYIGSHQVFGWPPADKPSIHVSTNTHRPASDASSNDDKDAGERAPDLGSIKMDGDQFVLTLDDGSQASIVTREGLVVLKNEDDEMKIVAVGHGSDKLLTSTGDHRYRIATQDVTSLVLKDDEGKVVSIGHANDNPSAFVWDIRDDDGADHVQFEQDARGNTSRLAVKSGADSVVIDPDKGLSIKSGSDKFSIDAPMGWSMSPASFRCALAMLVGGVLGLIVCIWLTRVTWRALSRHVHRQIDALSARLDGHEQRTT